MKYVPISLNNTWVIFHILMCSLFVSPTILSGVSYGFSRINFMFETPWIVCQIYILFFIVMKHRVKLDFIAARTGFVCSIVTSLTNKNCNRISFREGPISRTEQRTTSESSCYECRYYRGIDIFSSFK